MFFIYLFIQKVVVPLGIFKPKTFTTMKVSAAQKSALKSLILSKVGPTKYGNSLKYALSVHIKYIDKPWDGGFEGEGSVACALKCAVTILSERQPVEELVIDILRYEFEDGVREYDDLLDTVALSTEEMYQAIGVDNPFAAVAVEPEAQTTAVPQSAEFVTVTLDSASPWARYNGKRLRVILKHDDGTVAVLIERGKAGGFNLTKGQYSDLSTNESPAESAEYRVWYYPVNDQVAKYGWTNCLETAFVDATSEEEAVKKAGPMSRLHSVARLAHVDADFGPMELLQVRAAKKVIREQMERGEVIRTSFDYLVNTIDGENAVDFLKKNVQQSSDGVYYYGGQAFKIWWAGVSSGYAGSKVWEVVRTYGSQADDVTPEYRREGGRFECEESMSKTKGADLVTAQQAAEYVTINAESTSELSQFNGQRVKVEKALKEGSVKIAMTEDGEPSTAYLMTDQYIDRSTNPTQGMSTLHGVAYTPAEQAQEGDIAKGPVTLYKVSSFNWNPKTHPGTLDAWRSVGEMMEYFALNNRKPSGYLFRITVSEFEVNFLSGDMKGACCFWNQHVTDVRKDPYSESLIESLKTKTTNEKQ